LLLEEGVYELDTRFVDFDITEDLKELTEEEFEAFSGLFFRKK